MALWVGVTDSPQRRGFEWMEAWKSELDAGSFLLRSGSAAVCGRFENRGTRAMAA
jgi:hypothetical protein